jgi:hypothetical protein
MIGAIKEGTFGPLCTFNNNFAAKILIFSEYARFIDFFSILAQEKEQYDKTNG